MTKDENMFLTGTDSFKAYANQKDDGSVDNLSNLRGIARTVGSSRTFLNHDTNISVRSDYNRSDYEWFKPSDTVPQKQKEIIGMCMEAYQKIGLVRNVIDLMGDFGSQGIRLQHPNPSIQQFYNSWWKKVDGGERSERFLNQLYRCGQVITKRAYGKVSQYAEKNWKKGTAKESMKVERLKVNQREIPLRYTFMNPLNVEVIADELAQFVGQPILGLKISTKLRTAISNALKVKEENLSAQVKSMLEKIPADVLKAIKSGAKLLPLDAERVNVYYYKKDDWMIWANPMCYCILDDLLMLNKLKLADISALDGAISNIRLWTLGVIGDGPANSILPTKAGINKLRNVLANNVGGGVLDLVWGPELKFQESNSQVWRFLGAEKYSTTINAIYEGLGIPVSLRGAGGSSGTGNFVGLNTLIKRLEYGRDSLVNFWDQELKYIHKAMDFAGPPPQIAFDFMALADEPAEKQLLINLWDRDIISDETITELFGRLPEIEKSRVKRELNDRTNERMPYKASPFHNPDKEHEYRKILLQGGGVAPSEIGIDLNDRKVGEPTRLEQLHESQKELKQLDIENQQVMKDKDIQKQKELKKMGTPGRPLNVTETKKRKPKPTGRPSTKASFVNLFLWANSAQEIISDIVTPSLLYAVGKKNLRSLSHEEFDNFEKVKLNILSNIDPFVDITEGIVREKLQANLQAPPELLGVIKTLVAQFKTQNSRIPVVSELRQIYSSAYSLMKEEE
jgi:hypothetical protein